VFELPSTAAWRHRDARLGFEVLFIRHDRGCLRLEGHSTAVEEDKAWAIRYDLTVDERWVTRSAHVIARSALGEHEVRLEADGTGVWQIDGKAAPRLGGCLDIDLEASACTNALPIHRLGLSVGGRADAPAAYVRAPMLRVERLEQTYARLPDDGESARYEYVASAFDFGAVLTYDRYGLVLDYPGIALRVA
jgi:hypothetical protein